STLCEEDRARRFRCYKLWASGGKISFKRSCTFLADGNNSLFVALADDVDEAGVEMQLFEPKVSKLRESQTGSVSRFEDGLVAKAGRCFRSFGGQQVLDFTAGEGLGQAFPTARQRKVFGDILRQDLFVLSKAVESVQRRDFEVKAFAAKAAP